MIDILNDKINPEDYPDSDRALVDAFNRRVEKYSDNVSAMQVVYNMLGLRLWIMEFDRDGNVKKSVWTDFTVQGGEKSWEYPGMTNVQDWKKKVHYDDIDRLDTAFWKAVNDKEGKTPYDEMFRVVDDNGNVKWNRSVGNIIRREDGSPRRVMGLLLDISEKIGRIKAIEEQYEIVEALSRDYLNIFLVNVHDRTAGALKLDGYITEGFGDKTVKNYPYDAFYKKYVNDRVYEEDQDLLYDAMALDTVIERLSEKDEYTMSYRAVDNGEIHFYQFTYLRIKSHSGEEKVIAGFKNIDETVASAREREKLRILSETDLMTHVYNRGFGEKISRETLSGGECGLFLILDIDDFKHINDTYGHDLGDKVIISVADNLVRAFRKSDIVFRLGGDEFAVLATGVKDKDTAEKLVERFFDYLKSTKIEGMEDEKIHVSLGASIFDPEDDECASFEDLYKKADLGVYESKETKGNTYTFK